jgi:hypothetical protein
MISPIIEAAANLAARIIENELRAQAPSEKISKGVSVLPAYSGGGTDLTVEFEIYLEENVIYGIFLDGGTLDQYDPNPDAQWNPDPGVGKGGIEPRYWTNIPEEVQSRIDMIIETALEEAQEKQIEADLDKQFDNI